MNKHVFIIGICILLFSVSCVEPFQPEIGDYKEAIVIEGRVLEGANKAQVKISRTFAFSEKEGKKVSRATVEVRDDQGGKYILAEVADGEYESDTSQFQGIAGRNYQLFVSTPDGKSYESEWALLKKGIPISDMYALFEEHGDNQFPIQGMEIYVGSFDPEGQTVYYRWDYEETWEFSVPYAALGVWNLATNRPVYYGLNEIPQTCWKTERSTGIILHSTQGLEEDRVADFPVRYISTAGPQLYYKYSILVKQYSLTQQTYEYWQSLKRTTEEPGSLFDPIPTEIIGNIHNVNDPLEPVLGFFSADGISSRRIFIRRGDMPPVIIRDGYDACPYDTLNTALEMSDYVRTGGVYSRDVTNPFGVVIGYTGTQKRCADCRVDGTLEKPDFWE